MSRTSAERKESLRKITRLELEKVFDSIDTRGSGQISQQDFLQGARTQSVHGARTDDKLPTCRTQLRICTARADKWCLDCLQLRMSPRTPNLRMLCTMGL